MGQAERAAILRTAVSVLYALCINDIWKNRAARVKSDRAAATLALARSAEKQWRSKRKKSLKSPEWTC